MLYEHYMQRFYKMERSEENDGEGGTIEVWEETVRFDGVVTLDRSNPAVIADSERLANTFTLTVNTATDLNFHDVVKDSNGATYRVISSYNQTPFGFTSLDMRQYKLERWNIQ